MISLIACNCMTAFPNRSFGIMNILWSNNRPLIQTRYILSGRSPHQHQIKKVNGTKTFHRDRVVAVRTKRTYYNPSYLITLLVLCIPSSVINSQKITLSSNEEKKKVNQNKDDNDDDDIPLLHENCPFCRYFLQSPCKDPFIPWRKCVQENDDATNCMEQFKPLHDCMKGNDLIDDNNDNEENKDQNKN